MFVDLSVGRVQFRNLIPKLYYILKNNTPKGAAN